MHTTTVAVARRGARGDLVRDARGPRHEQLFESTIHAKNRARIANDIICAHDKTCELPRG